MADDKAMSKMDQLIELSKIRRVCMREMHEALRYVMDPVGCTDTLGDYSDALGQAFDAYDRARAACGAPLK